MNAAGCRHVSPIVIAPVTAIVGLGLLEYGFPGVCCLCPYGICENQHYQHHLLSVPFLLQLHCTKLTLKLYKAVLYCFGIFLGDQAQQ
jgi:hypothetical protein